MGGGLLRLRCRRHVPRYVRVAAEAELTTGSEALRFYNAINLHFKKSQKNLNIQLYEKNIYELL